MNIKEEEKILERQCENAKNKIIKENIFLIFNKISNKKYSEYFIDISFNNNVNPKLKKDYEFTLEINLAKKSIVLFSKNINPISDGRDILPLLSKNSVISNNFSSIENINIIDIINSIKNFLRYEKYSGFLNIFYLGEEYDKKIIDNLENIEKIQCYHLDIIYGRPNEIASLCTISDENFCLYEKNQNKYYLVFYSSIRNLLSFNKTIDSIVTLNWKKIVLKNEKERKNCIFELKIRSNIDEDMDKVMDVLIEKIKNIGFKMNINEQKKGVLPNLNAEKIEGEIIRLESQLKNRDNILVFNKLLENYEKIIEYYSAANNNKYTEYNIKMKELLENEKYSKYIN